MLRQRKTDERGAFTVLIAISLLSLLGLTGLVIDGGRAYAARRGAQNGADVAALAGAGALNGVLFNSTGQEAVVYDAVAASLAANDIDGVPECRLVDETRADLGPCPQSNTGAGLPADVAGVSVRARDNQDGSFIKALGIDGFSASAGATAQIQALRAASSPFLICGRDAANDGFDPPLLLESAGSWAVNPAAINQRYRLHAAQVPDCGAGGNSFKGLADGSAAVPVPGWWADDTGVHAGPIRNVVARRDGCTDSQGFDNWMGCTLVVPMCVNGRGTGAGAEMYCVRFGVFRVSQSHANSHDAVFLGGGIVRSGQGGGRPVANEARVIKLSQ